MPRDLLGGGSHRDLLAGGGKPPLSGDQLLSIFREAGRSEGDRAVRRTARAADDLARLGASGVTLGLADRLAAAMPGGGSLREQREQTVGARGRTGPLGTAAEVAGAVVPMATGFGAAARAIPATVRTVRGAAATGTALGAAETELRSTAETGKHASIWQLLVGSVSGGAGAAAGNVVGRSIEAGVDVVDRALRRFTGMQGNMRAELRGSMETIYHQLDEVGGGFSSAEVRGAMDGVRRTLNKSPYHPKSHPHVATELETLRGLARRRGGVHPREVEKVRQRLRGIAERHPDEAGIAMGVERSLSGGLEREAGPELAGLVSNQDTLFKMDILLREIRGLGPLKRTGPKELSRAFRAVTKRADYEATFTAAERKAIEKVAGAATREETRNGLRSLWRGLKWFAASSAAGVPIEPAGALGAAMAGRRVGKAATRRAIRETEHLIETGRPLPLPSTRSQTLGVAGTTGARTSDEIPTRDRERPRTLRQLFGME